MATYTCDRCCGSGEMPHHRHIEAGVCFACRGVGKVSRRPRPLNGVGDTSGPAMHSARYYGHYFGDDPPDWSDVEGRCPECGLSIVAADDDCPACAATAAAGCPLCAAPGCRASDGGPCDDCRRVIAAMGADRGPMDDIPF